MEVPHNILTWIPGTPSPLSVGLIEIGIFDLKVKCNVLNKYELNRILSNSSMFHSIVGKLSYFFYDRDGLISLLIKYHLLISLFKNSRYAAL